MLAPGSHRVLELMAVRTGLALALVLPASAASAGNTVHPRTPVLWPDANCVQTVDLSVEPEFAFEYAIPFEDALLSADELDDSRRHQFIGFCRQWPAGRPPPRYVSLADLDRAVTGGFEDAAALDDPESTLETSEAWADCWTRITPDADRRPITWESAAAPVVWALDGVAPGTWLIAGYTWEPPYNIWSRAPWVVRVVDGVSPEPPQAAVAIAEAVETAYPDDTVELSICVDAAPDSTLRLDWAPSKAEQLTWTEITSVALANDGPGELVVPFSPPEASYGLTIVLRASLDNSLGRDYDGHALDPLIVFIPPAEETDSSADGGSEGESDTDGDGSGSGSTDSAGATDSGAAGGCCSIVPTNPAGRAAATWALLALVAAGRRVRRARQLQPPQPRRPRT